MKHISVTQKLWLGVGGIVLGAVVIVALAGLNSARHQKTHEERDRLLSQRLEQATRWSALSQVNAVRTEALVLGEDAQDEAGFAEQIARTSGEIDTLAQSLRATAQDDEDRRRLQALEGLRQVMRAQRAQAVALKGQGQTNSARQLLRTQYRQAAASYLADLQALGRHQAEGLAQMRAQMGAARQGVVRGAALNMALLLLAVSVGAWLLISGIRRSLVQANAVAGQIAAGNLAVQVGAPRMDEFGRLLCSLQGMSGSLGAMIGEVRDSGDAIALASAEIASGNQDLSERTEQTSSHLQQASSAMQQLTRTLQTTAQGAQQAAGLAQRACAVAQRGGQEVGEVVSTMNDIHARSQKIADITGVIDSIAFQTNILALNAAVEAARAGDSGRGFAVVAAEVRQLAQRSAQAAREIKQLIQDSVDRAADGARLVHNAGGTMAEVVRAISDASSVMGDINTSVAEQRDSMAQVNDAVSALERMTLQNAALVEQSAAAAHSMHQQSEQLQALVQRFHVAQGAAPAGAALQPAPAIAAPRRRLLELA
ncbi:methyl-accepting chemotaxis protein [Pulveribacter suum]|uniref:Methyl-accepting chemotaxis protein n=1 Tax=Pulveribacter suum TaxID=2116657 RepID=A0A2P1NK91_9BURK|nr:methyl-accepting chemotaxis protein [Pulveribacter suum]AVP57479.1 methyl-accepting chemotaxis protein [Pulveribacter suum]